MAWKLPTVPPDDLVLLATCIHEAGHAVVDEAEGIPARRVEAGRDGSGLTVARQAIDFDAEPDKVAPRMVGGAAGALAELEWIRWTGLDELAAQVRAGAASDDADLEELSRYPSAITVGEAHDRALIHIGDRFDEIVVLANELYEAGPSWWSGTHTLRV